MQHRVYRATSALLVCLLVLAGTACRTIIGEPSTETAIVEVTSAPISETVVAEVTPQPPVPTATPTPSSFITPHPILGDVRVRQAIAYCTNRLELIESVYPFLSVDGQYELVMDTFVPQGHWAATSDLTTYPFDPQTGQESLAAAGWQLPADAAAGSVRRNAAGDLLVLKLTTNDVPFRRTWTQLFANQLLENCGIQVIPTYAPSAWWFGPDSGLQRRDFEVGAFAWQGDPDPKGQSLYACNQIPRPEYTWQGQNYMGWCNPVANRAIIAANTTLDRQERIKQYALFQQEFTQDMVSLPLFQRLNVYASSIYLLNIEADPIEFITANVAEWDLETGDPLIAMVFAQEPETLWTHQQPSSTVGQLADLINFRAFTRYEYDYQPVALQQLPTLENGGAQLEPVAVTAGDRVWDATGRAVELAPGIEIIDSDGQVITYTQGLSVTMNQLRVTFDYVDNLAWEDGKPVTRADFELAARLACDTPIAGTGAIVCASRQEIDFTSDHTYTITYLPGVLWPEYFIYTAGLSPFGNQEAYPAHREITSDNQYTGMALGDVPSEALPTLPEISRDPLSSGPYRLVEWEEDTQMVFETNPSYYAAAPIVPNFLVRFTPDVRQAVVQLLTGEVDLLDPTMIDSGADVVDLLQAAERGEIQAFLKAGATWEHIDMNLFVR